MKNCTTDSTTRPFDIPLAACASGAAAIVLQTLIFRSFFTVFEGNEWSVALFFFSWLLWSAIGAGLARLLPADWRVATSLPLMILCYLPAGILQFFLTHASRRLSGATAFDSFTALSILPGVLLANAPASLVCGFFFMLLVRTTSQNNPDTPRPASRVYVWEAIGSFAGGAVITMLLVLHGSSVRIFLLLTLLLSLCSLLMLIRRGEGKRLRTAIPLVSILLSGFMLATGTDGRITDTLDRRGWQTLLPGGHWLGTFSTPANRYLYGTYQDQFSVLAGTSIIESIPDREAGERLALLVLAQQPDAANVLLIGPGLLPVAQALAARQPPARATWLNPDETYAHQLLAVLPEAYGGTPESLSAPIEPIHRFLHSTTQRYDTAILNLASDGTMANSILFTSAFLENVKRRLAPDGCLYVRIEGGANYMGRELILTDATLYRSLNGCFNHVVVIPGDASWLAASDSSRLTGDPEMLIARLQSARPAWNGWPPELLRDICNPPRAALLQNACESEQETLGTCLNHTILQPKLTLFTTLTMLRKSMPNMPDITRLLPFLMRSLFLLLLAGSLWGFLAAWIPHEADIVPRRIPAAETLVAFAGFSGFAQNYILLILFQACFGTLFIHIGWLSALFMGGLFAGGTITMVLLKKTSLRQTAMTVLGLYLSVCLSTGLIALRPSVWLFDLLFFLAGCCSAGFIPMAETLFLEQGVTCEQTGRRIAWYDYLGGAAAALCGGLLILPLIGITRLLIVLSCTSIALLLPLIRLAAIPKIPQRKPGHILLPLLLATVAMTCAWLITDAKQARIHPTPTDTAFEPPRPLPTPVAARTQPVAQAPITETPSWTSRTLELSDGFLFPYEERTDTETNQRLFRFKTQALAGAIHGFIGPIPMIITLSEQGVLLDIDFLSNQETPEYFAIAEAKTRSRLIGQPVRKDVFPAVDAMTGATISANAIRETILAACERFFDLLSNNPHMPDAAAKKTTWNIPSESLPGIPREVNERVIREMIERGELSDHPALLAAPVAPKP